MATVDASFDQLLLKGLLLMPISSYLVIAFTVLIIFSYILLEVHIIEDVLSGFRDTSALHGFSSPHLQTILFRFLVETHNFNYKRELFRCSDGGTIALDWLMNFDEAFFQVDGNNMVARVVPVVIVIPGLTSDSDSAYIKYVAYNMAKHGYNVVISNHRGLGGESLTSDCFYTGGWTEDLREIVNHLHSTQPETPLLVIGTSLGANILVKYLGEDGTNAPIVGAASICNPWDLLMGDRFFHRGLMQRFYNRVLANNLKDMARMNKAVYARIADWEGIEKARSVGEFNKATARIIGKFETVDTFHRWASSARLVTSVTVPLLCINAIDDPVCTYEAIPYDECRMNKNIVLATTQHGGHNAFFTGMSGKNLWWVRVVEEYFSVLRSSSLMNKKQVQVTN